jgi:hypothetical protein
MLLFLIKGNIYGIFLSSFVLSPLFPSRSKMDIFFKAMAETHKTRA